MKRHGIVLILVTVIVAGCQSTAQSLPEPPPQQPSTVTTESASPLTLNWQKAAEPAPLKTIEDWPQRADRVVKTTSLSSPENAPLTVHIYAKAEDEEWLWAALTKDDTVYDIGAVAGYGYDQDDQLLVEMHDLFSTSTVRITGAVGAAASITHYVDVSEAEPILLLMVDTGHVMHQDVDGDGQAEVVASSGTAGDATVYRQHGDRLEWLWLSDSLQADYARITPEDIIEVGTWANSAEIERYRLGPEGLFKIEVHN
ncbi:hypothetical protein [Paenibacillus daejeonensis]|uniref:hypothetical protein n=1 Tax=Paenibacillus daejeonensis TaxID=135193 RepID=UPI00037F79FC|nr:hypothetical protein [Paenibacillus daejeonensis]